MCEYIAGNIHGRVRELSSVPSLSAGASGTGLEGLAQDSSLDRVSWSRDLEAWAHMVGGD